MDHSLAINNLQIFVATLLREHVENFCVEFTVFSFFALLTGPISPFASLCCLLAGVFRGMVIKTELSLLSRIEVLPKGPTEDNDYDNDNHNENDSQNKIETMTKVAMTTMTLVRDRDGNADKED